MPAASLTTVLACALALQGQLSRQDNPKQPPAWRPAPQKIEGQWTVVYVEIEGKKVTDKALANVVIKDNVLHYKHDGKDMAYKLEFGPYHMLKATELPAKEAPKGGKEPITPGTHTHVGVFVASQEYLTLALNKRGMKGPKDIGSIQSGAALTLVQAAGQQPGTEGWVAGAAPYNAALILILRREGPSKDKSP